MMIARCLAVLIAVMTAGCTGAPSRQEPAGAGRTGSSFDKMWETVRSDPKRMQLLFGEHFHVENFSSGTCPQPYTAHHRLKVAWREEVGRRMVVVNRQAVLSLQNQDENMVPDYHAPTFEEEELIFDEHWRLVSIRTWTWGGQDEPGTSGFYCRYRTGYGHCAYCREGTKFICSAGPETGKSWALDDSLPSTRAAELLFRVGADFAIGKLMATRPIPTASAQEVTFTPAESRWGEKNLRVEVGDRYYVPSKGEYGWGANQCGAEFKTASRDAFRKALRKFITESKTETLADKDGRVVDPPLGLGILDEKPVGEEPPK